MTPQISGDCHRCGLCCEVNGFRCEHLLLEHGKVVGDPEASACQVYDQRYQGMPIRLFDATKEHYMIGHCAKDTQEEVEHILPYIGRGCSLIQIEGGRT